MSGGCALFYKIALCFGFIITCFALPLLVSCLIFSAVKSLSQNVCLSDKLISSPLGDCSREGRICGMHKNWGRCVDKFIQDQCPCTCTSSTPTDNNRSNSGRDYNRYNGSGETESTNDSRNGLGISR